MAVADVDGIAVLRVPWTAHRDAVDDDIARVERMHMKTGGVLEGDTLKEDVLAVSETDEVVTSFLLSLRSITNIRRSVLHVPGIPQLTVVSLNSTHSLEAFPLHVAHLRAFHRSPLCTITVDYTLTRDGDILTL